MRRPALLTGSRDTPRIANDLLKSPSLICLPSWLIGESSLFSGLVCATLTRQLPERGQYSGRFQSPGKSAAAGERNGPVFLGYDQHHGVAVLAHPDSRAMTGAERQAHARVLRQWQQARRGQHGVAIDYYGAVVERRAVHENRFQQLGRNLCVQKSAGLDKLRKAIVLLDHDQRADFTR